MGSMWDLNTRLLVWHDFYRMSTIFKSLRFEGIIYHSIVNCFNSRKLWLLLFIRWLDHLYAGISCFQYSKYCSCNGLRSVLELLTFRPEITFTSNVVVTGSAVGFRLDSLLKLTDTRARNNKMTLMHYLCKVMISMSIL